MYEISTIIYITGIVVTTHLLTHLKNAISTLCNLFSNGNACNGYLICNPGMQLQFFFLNYMYFGMIGIF